MTPPRSIKDESAPGRRGVRYPLSVRMDAVQRVQNLRNSGIKVQAAVAMVAVIIGCNRQTLGNWLRSAKRRQQPQPRQDVRADQYISRKLTALQYEVEQLRRANVELHRIIEAGRMSSKREVSLDCPMDASLPVARSSSQSGSGKGD